MYNKIRSVTRFLSSRASTNQNSLKEILRKNGPRHNVPSLLQNWVDSGHVISSSDLKSISNRLIKSNRYNLALQIMEWTDTRKDLVTYDDTALRLELIIKTHGLKQAEEYFEKLPTRVAKSAYLRLLRGYVKLKLVKEAEGFMEKLNGLGFLVNPHPFNEMMKFYEKMYRYGDVVAVVLMMKRNKIPRNVLSYNLWMNACCEVSGVAGVETVYKEMVGDKSVEVGWSSLCTLANVYVKCGFRDKASLVLERAEKTLNRKDRLGYFFLITLYASLGDKEGVVRLWEASKSVSGRVTCANYICVLSSLVKLGDLAEAERVFGEWEAECCNYDVRVSNVLLGAYARNGQIGKAEALHNRVLERGGDPNYKTWEILMEGWVKCESMEKAIDAMHRAIRLMKHCHWRPSENIILAIAEYFEKEEKIDQAYTLVRDLHRLGLASLPVYRLLLRMHVNAQRPAFEIFEMMKLDKIPMGEEM